MLGDCWVPGRVWAGDEAAGRRTPVHRPHQDGTTVGARVDGGLDLRTRSGEAVMARKTRRKNSSRGGSSPAGETSQPSRQPPPEPVPTEEAKAVSECAVVGLGASAGGLDAFKKFFGAMPANSGMAFVL